MVILEFENVWESELVAALQRALDAARVNGSNLESKIRLLINEAEAAEMERAPLQ